MRYFRSTKSTLLKKRSFSLEEQKEQKEQFSFFLSLKKSTKSTESTNLFFHFKYTKIHQNRPKTTNM